MHKSRLIPVAELRVGMFVSKLDRDWLETPFLLQGFSIEEESDIDEVARYCESVWIDEVRSSVTQKEPTTAKTPFLHRLREDIFAPEVPLQDEHKRVINTFKKARVLTKRILQEFQAGAIVDAGAAKDTVDQCVDSVIRHPDALLWMSKIRRESEYTAEHCLNVCILAVAFGRQLELSREDLSILGMCALLHDVGKMKVPRSILDKPGKLTDKERRLMMMHSVHGRNLLLRSKGISDIVVDVAYSHHERVDGRGYPRSLQGAEISRFAKIVALVDAYDAMTADRCYQPAKTSTEAMRIIYEERGSHFDEELTLQFIRMLGIYPVGSIVELHSGNVGIVIESNTRYKQLPKVLLKRDSSKEALDKEVTVDLARIESGDLGREFLIKRVWKDNSFGLSVNSYLEHGLFL